MQELKSVDVFEPRDVTFKFNIFGVEDKVKVHLSRKYLEGPKKSHSLDDGKGYVYFITDGEYVKIGSAKDVEKRLRTLQTGNAKKLCVILRLHHSLYDRIELALHKKYAKYRLCGEWFDLAGYYAHKTGYNKSFLLNKQAELYKTACSSKYGFVRYQDGNMTLMPHKLRH